MKTFILVSLLVSLVRASDLFAFDEALSCPDGQFRSLDGEAQSCKVCYKPTFRAAYGVASPKGTGDMYQHTKCCANPDQHVCQVMKAEYEANCPCATDNDHCFQTWDPTGVNVIHLNLTLLEDPNQFQYTAAAGEDQAFFEDWQALSYNINSPFKTYISFLSLIPGGPEVLDKEMTVENQQIEINCTEADLAPWCALTTKSCTRATAMIMVSSLTHPTADSTWSFTLSGTILNRDGEAGDIELLVVDYAESMHQYYNVLNEDVTQHDQWERDNNQVRCITGEGGSCPVIAGTRRRRLQPLAPGS